MTESAETERCARVRRAVQPVVLEGSRWKCPKCGSTHVQVALPTWYRETSGGTLQLVNTDEEAEVQYWYCEACEGGGSGEPARV